MDPYSQHCSFQNLLNSQQPNPRPSYHSVSREPSIELSVSDASVFGSQWTEDGNEDAEIVSDRKERHKWSPTEDGVLISAWLNTSKDPLVGNEQKAIVFWKRIAASPKAGWFANERDIELYEAAMKQRSSGQNEDDVLKMAHQIFYNDYKVKFTLEYAWLELRHDQKWCGAPTTKDRVQSKRRKLDDQSAASSTYMPGSHGEDESMARPEGVKAAKAKGKKGVSKPATLEEEEGSFKVEEDMRQNENDVWGGQHHEGQKRNEPTLKENENKDTCSYGKIIFSEDATYPSIMFRHRFRMNKPLFMRIVDRLSAEISYFQQRRDATGRFGHSLLQKATAAIRMMAYGCPADAVDEYLRLGECTALLCLEHFVQGIMNLFGDEYLRRPTPEDFQRLLDMERYAGFSG
ncbi:glutathione S-transferase T3-like [Brassica napus]|uniref:glutathione S-transferase T3-like n=1 Tax=Brassica napus TaxID=3708 RepID=UPI000BBE362F|nr:glutathione S-transferase T3-like [Brassica napus]